MIVTIEIANPEQEIAILQVNSGEPGVGVPVGGVTGQVLQKATNADYDTVWGTPAGGGDMLAAANLSDVGNAATAFSNIKQSATTSATGVVELATSAETTGGLAVQANDTRLSDARTPTSHATSHQNAGSDPIKLDDLATPDDNTDLDASASRHGLLKKLSNVVTEFLDGTGNFSTPAGSGSGSVTTVSVVTANGISGSVANPTSTPAITLTLGVITPTSVNGVVFSGSATPTLAVSGTSSISGVNTGDQTTVTGNAGTATALQTSRNINGVAFDGTANITVTAAAGTLTGATLAANVTASSLTSAAGGSFGTAAFTATTAYTASGVVPNTAPSAGQLLVGNAGGTAYAPVAASGDATVASTGAITVANDAITNAKAANMAASTFKARVTGSTGDPEDATVAQANALLQADGLTTDAAGFRGIPQNSRSAAYTVAASDNGKHLYHPSADTTARTWTIDSNANLALPIGFVVTFINDSSAGVITIAITSDTLVLAGAGTTGSRTLAANGVATAIKITSTRWQINGTGLT